MITHWPRPTYQYFHINVSATMSVLTCPLSPRSRIIPYSHLAFEEVVQEQSTVVENPSYYCNSPSLLPWPYIDSSGSYVIEVSTG